MKKPFRSAMLLSFAAAGVYHALKGSGIFNKPRFSQQHDAVSKYVETNYPGGRYAPIMQTANGWATVITAANGTKIPLYVSRSSDGIYLYQEGAAVK